MKNLGIVFGGMYLFTSWGYFLMYLAGNELVVQYAKGLFFVMMMGGPVLTGIAFAFVMAGGNLLKRREPTNKGAGQKWPWA